MIEIKNERKVNNLYNEVKNIILNKKDNPSFKYNHKQHRLYEESKYPGISKNYYNESGTVEFENINGKIIKLEIHRWHPRQHNGYSGLNGNPCLTAKIYTIENEENRVLWKLNVDSRTLYYKAEVSSLEIPYDILQEKHISTDSSIQENKVTTMVEDEIKTISKIIESQGSRTLFNEIANLYNKYKTVEQIKDELLLEREKEIEEATEKITKSYSQKLTQNNEDITSAKKELNDLEKWFAKYSTFNIDLVGNALQQLITIVESEEYLYKQVTHKIKKRVHGIMDDCEEDIQTKVRIIVRKDKLMNCYESPYPSENIIKQLVKNGEALLLSEQNINTRNNQKITFYASQDGQVLCYVNYGRFGYIKKFIDSIVQYRFQNNMLEFTEKDMILFMRNFVIRYKDIIMENYSSKIKEKSLSLRLDIS